MALHKKQYSIEVGGRPLTIEHSELADQTNASVLVRYGGTVVLATAVMTRGEVGLDYLPLKVDYEERFYAAGKIIGSRYIRREGKSSEEAVLAGRLIDRVLRPLFDQGMRHEIQVVVTVLAIDEENDPRFAGLVGASTALSISDIPFNGPAAGVSIGRINGALVVNPSLADAKGSKCEFETFAAGPNGKINMIELGGTEAKEEDVAAAFELARKNIDTLTAFQEGIAKEIGKPKFEAKLYVPNPEVRALAAAFLDPRLEAAVYQHDRKVQYVKLHDLKRELFAHIEANMEHPDLKAAEFIFEETIDVMVRKNILERDRRPDGRSMTEVRQLSGEVGMFERTHGSALFVRGNTQALAVTTLAAPGAEQLIETMETTGKRRFMLHYNFPPYSVGEVGSFRGPGRREIGHGALAEKAVRPLIPTEDVFPYTIRVVNEIVSSNGSSSMATVCATMMSLMDAGVPIRKMAAGIAMGLMTSADGSFKVLTDLQGPEDHYGDMDFKVAGTEDGVNAIQLDVKVQGLTMEIIRQTLSQARVARLQILDFMKTVIAAPKSTISKYVPKILRISINPDKIGMVIGPGGKIINGFIKKYGLASIDIEEDGTVYVAANDPASAERVAEEIKLLTREFKVGDIIEGKVFKILDFGAIVDLGGGQDGMIHVSELRNGFVKMVTDVVKMGDAVRAKVISVDDEGHIRLSLKQLGDQGQ